MDGGAPLIAVDTNILVYAHRQELAQHRAARSALRELTESGAAWGLPVFVLGEFMRVVTHPRMHPPSDPRDAAGALDDVLESAGARILSPGNEYWRLLRGAILDAAARGNIVHDAEIVAVCREHGVDTILTEDRDFKRFPGLRVKHLPAASR